MCQCSSITQCSLTLLTLRDRGSSSSHWMPVPTCICQRPTSQDLAHLALSSAAVVSTSRHQQKHSIMPAMKRVHSSSPSLSDASSPVKKSKSTKLTKATNATNASLTPSPGSKKKAVNGTGHGDSSGKKTGAWSGDELKALYSILCPKKVRCVSQSHPLETYPPSFSLHDPHSQGQPTSTMLNPTPTSVRVA